MDGTGIRKDAQPRILDRELTWQQFNHRVQAEADHPANPLLERAKFLAIVSSNLDEFMQVRYHGVLEGAAGDKAGQLLPCGFTGAERLGRINKAILHQSNLQRRLGIL